MQADLLNRNERIYAENVLENAVNSYIADYVQTGKALGEINHPDRNDVDPKEAAIKIISLWWEGKNVMGKALVLNTPQGKVLQSLIDDGFVPGISSRGVGTSDTGWDGEEIVDFYKITALDIVNIPSAYEANLEPIYENSNIEEVIVRRLISYIKNF